MGAGQLSPWTEVLVGVMVPFLSALPTASPVHEGANSVLSINLANTVHHETLLHPTDSSSPASPGGSSTELPLLVSAANSLKGPQTPCKSSLGFSWRLFQMSANITKVAATIGSWYKLSQSSKHPIQAAARLGVHCSSCQAARGKPGTRDEQSQLVL